MLPNKQAEIDELLSRLFDADLSVGTLDIINGWRIEQATKKETHARAMSELAKQATYRIAKVEQLITGDGQKRDRIAEVITVKQSEVGAFCKANGVNKDELLSAMDSTRKEAVSKTGMRFQHFPLLFSEYSAQGNEEARKLLRDENEAYEHSLQKRAENKALTYSPVAEPAFSTWSKE